MKPIQTAALVVLLALMAAPVPSRGDELSVDEQLQALRARIEELEAENAKLRQALNEQPGDAPHVEASPVEAPAAEASPAVTEAAPSNAALAHENAELKRQLAEAQTTNQDLSQEKQQLEQLAGVTVKGESVESKIALFNSVFLESEDRTVVMSARDRISDVSATTMGDFLFFTSYSFDGQEMTEQPSGAKMSLLTVRRPNDRLRHVRNATFVVDGESVEVPVADYRILRQTRSAGVSRSSRGGVRTFDEQLTFQLDEQTLRQFARARSIRIELPNLALALRGEQVATFAAILKRFELGI